MSIYGARPALTPADFDRWRDCYASTSYADQVKYHRMIWKDYPVQRHYDIAAARRFFAEMADIGNELRVLEIGGWTGDVVAAILPESLFIYDWLNVELCQGAVDHPATADPRYRPVVLDDWIWNYPAEWFAKFDVLFASHSFEHMTGENIEQLLPLLGSIQRVYIDAPLEEEPVDWTGYHGAHVLEWGWRELVAAMRKNGFELDSVVNSAHLFLRKLSW